MSRMLRAIAIALLAWLSLGASAEAQNRRWMRAETPNFIIYCDRGETILRQAAQQLEDYDTTLRFLTSTNAPPPQAKLEIYLIREAQMQVVWPGASPLVRGFYSATPEIEAAFAIYNDAGQLDRGEILFHEYAHHFMLHYYPDAYPLWYVEGFAEYASTVDITSARRITVGRPSVARGRSIGLMGLLAGPDLVTPAEGSHNGAWWERYYSTSWIAATWVLSDPNHQRALHAYVAALGRGEDAVQAFQPAFGMTPDSFGDALRAFSRERSQLTSFTLNTPPPAITISTMPPSMDDLLLRVARARLGAAPGPARQALADDIDNYAGAFPNDTYAQLAAARAALLRDDRDAVRSRLTSVLAADDGNAEARYLMGASYVRDAEASEGEAQDAALHEARRQLARGLRANPDYYPSLYLHARSAQQTGAAMSDNEMNVLARAFELAPQVSTIRLMLVRELMMAQRYDDAGALLRPLLFAPHAPQLATYARRMADAARNHQPPPSWDDPVDEKETPSDPGTTPGGEGDAPHPDTPQH